MRAAVIGLGVMGKNHARVLRSMDWEVVTVDPAGHADHTSLDEVKGNLDVACIATPPADLAKTATEALARGCHVLIEKPMATTASKARRLIQIAEAQRLQTAVGYTERHNPAVRALNSNLARIGEVHHIIAERMGYRAPTPNDVMLDLCSHDVDVLRCLGFTPTLQHKVSTDNHAALTFDLGTDNGSATLQASFLSPVKARTLRVIGESGILAMDYQSQQLHLIQSKYVTEITVHKREPLKTQWQDFSAALQFDNPPTVTGTDGLRVLEILQGTPERAQDRALALVA